MKTYKKIIVIGLLLAITLTGAMASDREAPKPPPIVFEEIAGLDLSGTGEFDVWFWDIYVAALWAPQGRYSGQEPHALTLRYEREFTGRDIAERSIDEIRDLGIGNTQAQSEWLAQMMKLFPDVRAGDTLTGVHFPGDKAVFYYNDQRIGVITDPTFARAFFSIWLDQQTNAPALRGRLLGKRSGGLRTSDSR